MPIEITRRDLVRAGALAAAGGTLAGSAGCTFEGKPPGEKLDPVVDRVLVLSDTHIAEDAATVSRSGVNMAERFSAVLGRAMSEETRYRPGPIAGFPISKPAFWFPFAPRFALINGDAAYDIGTLGDYRTLVDRWQTTVEQSPRRAGTRMPLHVLLGNHDDRVHFRILLHNPPSELTDKHVRKLGVADGSRFCDWLLLDSLRVVDEVPGELEVEQLAWLDEALTESSFSSRPAIVVVHHPPVPDENPDKPFSLQDHKAFWDIAAKHPNVKAVLHGHTHRWAPRTWKLDGRASATPGPAVGDRRLDEQREVPLIGLAPTSYVFDEANPWGCVVADVDADGATFTMRAMDGHAADGEAVRVAF